MHREGTFGTVALLGRFPAVRTGVDVSGTLLLLVVGARLLIDTVKPQGRAAVEVRRTTLGRLGGADHLGTQPVVPVVVRGDRRDRGFAGAGPDGAGQGRVSADDRVRGGAGYLMLVSLLRRHDPQAGKVWVQRAIRAMGGVLVGIALGNAVVLVGRG